MHWPQRRRPLQHKPPQVAEFFTSGAFTGIIILLVIVLYLWLTSIHGPLNFE